MTCDSLPFLRLPCLSSDVPPKVAFTWGCNHAGPLLRPCLAGMAEPLVFNFSAPSAGCCNAAACVQSNYTAPRIVVAASGVPHDAFKNSVESLFLDLPTVSATAAPASQYVGGDFRMASDTAVGPALRSCHESAFLRCYQSSP